MESRTKQSINGKTADTRTALQIQLERWATQPLLYINQRTAIGTGLVMALVALLSLNDSDPIAFLRLMAIIMVGLHTFLHVGITRWLQHHLAMGVFEAETALIAFHNPRRISHIDRAVAWVMLAVMLSLLRKI